MEQSDQQSQAAAGVPGQPAAPRIAYFSMEIGLEADLPTYSGGLGVLAGDTLRAAADLGVPMVGITLAHREGYLRQHLDAQGRQSESAMRWSPEARLPEAGARATVSIEGREVQIRAWRYDVTGAGGSVVPVLLLDSDLPENEEYDRTLTHHLYGGDGRYRLCQEVILGIGGVRLLAALGWTRTIDRYHMNEGHAALLGLELLEASARAAGRRAIRQEDVEAVRCQCVFTTHTPVPAGHDQFDMRLVRRVVGVKEFEIDWRDVVAPEGRLNLTYMALSLSRYVNGVAKRHGEISRLMFAGYSIDAITNGVHVPTWTAPPVAALFDRYIPDWRKDSFELRSATSIPRGEIREAHGQSKRRLLETVAERTGVRMDPQVLTLGFARRATAYKRADLLLSRPDRLAAIARRFGGIQVVYAGKAHPRDEEGKRLIERVFASAAELARSGVRVAYLENYDMTLGGLLTAGVDVWLNTPMPPMEASGTSGMKAAINGVPSLSVLDGWWVEGCTEGVTGWAIGGRPHGSAQEEDRSRDAEDLYEKLESAVVPMFCERPDDFADVMLQSIGLNGSFFNTHRMVQQYVLNAYYR